MALTKAVATRLSVSVLLLGVLTLLALLAYPADCLGWRHNLVWALNLRPTNSCMLIHPKAVSAADMVDDSNLGMQDMESVESGFENGMLAQYWYCDQVELPWPELDLNWCLANWNDGKLVVHDGWVNLSSISPGLPASRNHLPSH